MSKAIILSLCFIMAGVSFLIMSIGCIKNKYIVYFGVLLFIGALVLFLVGFSDIIFIDNSKIGG